MADSDTQNTSIDLYHYLCQNIVGTEEHVKTIRMMNNVRDNLQINKRMTIITSGSFGEGLQMRGSDLDIIVVFNHIEVVEDAQMCLNADKTCFVMDMVDTQPGFSMLRLLQGHIQRIFAVCGVIKNDYYFSNISFKQDIMAMGMTTMHGPCISDEDGLYDFAGCLRSKLWITPAKQWITRSNNAWPTYDVKHTIVKHGVLFVPIGVKGSTHEELEWRISFSVAEKLLIYTFTHTQLLCYALMKILLKDVIALDIECKELLCSYFMKTVLFWICEELPPSIWKPANLISCFMRCFRRLIYCVEYSYCPHYIIPENNLFDNKIQGNAQETLLNKLHILYSYGWQCILLSDQISNVHAFAFNISKESSYLHVTSITKLLKSNMFVADNFSIAFGLHLENVIYKLLSCNSSKIKYLYTYNMSKNCFQSEQLRPFDDKSGNKYTYKQYNTYTSTLLLNTRHDAVSGWLMLASFFYKRKQYNTALYILQYSLVKCSPEKLHPFMNLSDIHYDLLNLHLFRKMPIVRLWRLLLLDLMIFTPNSMLRPDELRTYGSTMIPPVVYAHFLRFLCHYHLNNRRQYLDSLRDLQLTIEEKYCISSRESEINSYYVLWISFYLLGDIESANQTCLQGLQLKSCPNKYYTNTAFI